MDLRDYLDILRARWRLIIVTTLLGVMAAATASMLATPQYTATATTFVSVNGGDSTVGTALQGTLFAQDRVKSYVDVVSADGVMGAVIEDLGTAAVTGPARRQDRRQQPARHGEPGDLRHRSQSCTGAVDRQLDS